MTMTQFRAGETTVKCHMCDGTDFETRKVKLNTTAMSFFDLDWLNRSAQGLICQTCGYIHLYRKDSVIEAS